MGDKSANGNQLKSIRDEIREGLRELDALENKVIAQRAALQTLRRELWDTCNHQWRRDYSCSFDDPCKKSCVLCGLWRDRSLYS